MNRETKTIKIGNNEFVVKTYASAREANAIKQAYFKGTKVEVVDEKPRISEFNPTAQQEVEKEMVSQIVVSLNGSIDNVLEKALDLPAAEYNSLVKTLDEIVSKKN
jgi:hypothetical protein